MCTLDWLTRDYIEAAMRQNHSDDKWQTLKVHDLEIEPALGKGENYSGMLMRACVTYTLSNDDADEDNKNSDKRQQQQLRFQQHFVVKTAIKDDAFVSEKIRPYDIYNREMSIYKDILPKLHALLREINDPEQLFANAIHVDAERQALIFEDLRERGFVIADRVHGLDKAHILLILRKLAKMHATSAVLNERQAGSLEAYDRGFFNRYTDNYSSYFIGMLEACGEKACHWPGYEHYGEKLLALAPHYMEIGKRCFAPTPGHVNALVHGDFWTNNVMFKYDAATREPIDVLIIDFQYSCWGSPSIDLHFFFNTSLQEPLRQHGQDELVQFYYRIFTETLRNLNYKSLPLPTLREFRLQFEEKSFFGAHSALIHQPVIINEDTEDADFTAIMGEDDRANRFRSKLYDNQRVKCKIQSLLPIYESRGLLEVNQSD